MRKFDTDNLQIDFFPKPKHWKLKFISAAACLSLAVLLLLDWCFVRYRLLDESLAPVFWAGQKVVTYRLAYWLSPPQGADLIIYSPERGVFKPGKVLAVAGDVVALEQGKLFVNGLQVPVDHTYGNLSIPATNIPKGSICMFPGPAEMSLKFQLVSTKSVKGKIIGKWQVLLI